MKYILTLEKYIGYNDYKKGNWGTPSEIEEDVKSTINLILKPVSDKLKKVEFEELLDLSRTIIPPKNVEFVVTLGHYGSHVKQYLNIAHSDRKFQFIEID